jgi:EAL domain-containing protein (putative c-di-GMP-specific phosphodiesterase class I)/GGDEF domain-containing protein
MGMLDVTTERLVGRLSAPALGAARRARDGWTIDTPPAGATPYAFSRIGCLLYVSGGALVLFLSAVEDAPHGRRLLLAALGAAPVLLGCGVFAWGDRMPRAWRLVMNMLGSAMVLVVSAVATGPARDAITPLFLYVAYDSFAFFTRRQARLLCAWGLLCAAVAVSIARVRLPEVVGMAVVFAVTAVVSGWLMRTASVSEWDPLTGMVNRRGLERVLQQACEEGAVHPFTLLKITLGRRVGLAAATGWAPLDLSGDGELLVYQVAKAWRRLGDVGVVWAHLGGGEFAALLPGPRVDDVSGQGMDAEGLGSQGLDVPALHHRLGEVLPGHVLLAAGAADWVPGVTARHLLSQALDARLQSQASAGRLARAGVPYAEVLELRGAIASGQLRVQFQPIVELASRAVIGAEALVRWAHPERGLGAPDQFIALAEQTGLIRDLGLFVLEEAAQVAAAWPGGGDRKVTVNVSAHQLDDDGFVQEVVARTLQAGARPQHLVLEVTESALTSGAGRGLAQLEELRMLGFRIAVDDFGTGHSSLGRLVSMPVDILKIDRSFVPAGEHEAAREAVIRSVVALAEALGLSTVAEGVETQEQAALLTSLGADDGQGWLFGRPVPMAELFELLAASGRDAARAVPPALVPGGPAPSGR